MNHNPPAVVEEILLPPSPCPSPSLEGTAEGEERRKIFLIQESILPCGTKMRGLSFFHQLRARGVRHINTVASTGGYGQVAIAWMCRQAGLSCRIYVALSPRFTRVPLPPPPRELRDRSPPQSPVSRECYTSEARKENFLPENSQIAQSYGAVFRCCGEKCRTSTMEEIARRHSRQTPGHHFILCGISDPEYIEALAQAFRESAPPALGLPGARLWLAIGTGTIALALRKAFPDLFLHLVNVGMKTYDDTQEALDRSKICIHYAPERYWEVAEYFPPYQSLAIYDAKIWRFVLSLAQSGDFVWNVK